MSRRQFDPSNSPITKNDIHENDSWLFKVVSGQNWLDSFIIWLGQQFGDIAMWGRLLGLISDHIKFTSRNHTLAVWQMSNLSHWTANAIRNHRKWIWHLWYVRIPYMIGQAELFASNLVASERYYRKAADVSLAEQFNKIIRQVYDYLVKQISDSMYAAEAVALGYYERNKAYIDEVLKAAQAAAQAAFNNSVVYTNKVRTQMVQYANNVLKQSQAYTDKKASAAETNAVRKSELFTTAAIGALIAGMIADLIAQEAELATAEAADAAWIAGEGTLLQEELGQFGHDIKSFVDAAFITLMATYVGFGITDAKDTGDVTADVLIPILSPLADGVKSLIGLL